MIEIGHGSGGRMTRDLIRRVFLKYLSSDILNSLEDAAYLKLADEDIAMTTDSYVIRPLFFPGGDIGKLAVCGTVNDLVVSGAVPQYLSAGFILEEGFPLQSLEQIVKSIRDAGKAAGVTVVTGDTKVVEKGKCDGVFINTTGIGRIQKRLQVQGISPGDAVIATGTVGDHGIAIALARNEFAIEAPVQSDCAALHELLMPLFLMEGIRWMRDPTRGGLATVLAELAGTTGLGIQISDERIPVRDDVRFISDMLGFDPLYLANEGKAVVIVAPDAASDVMQTLRKHPLGNNAAVIGSMSAQFKGARLKTKIGGERLLDLLEEELLPRIC